MGRLQGESGFVLELLEAQGNFRPGPPATLPGESKFSLAQSLRAVTQLLALLKMTRRKP